MQEQWNTLVNAGLPDGAPRPPPARLDFDAIRAALSAIDVTRLDGVQAVTLLAWLKGWQHHWPSRFERELGLLGEEALRALSDRGFDPNRYLKLRRIAVENLAAVL